MFSDFSDTDLKAKAFLIQKLREMTSAEKLRLTLDFSLTLKRLILAGIRRECPEMTEEEGK